MTRTLLGSMALAFASLFAVGGAWVVALVLDKIHLDPPLLLFGVIAPVAVLVVLWIGSHGEPTRSGVVPTALLAANATAFGWFVYLRDVVIVSGDSAWISMSPPHTLGPPDLLRVAPCLVPVVLGLVWRWRSPRASASVVALGVSLVVIALALPRLSRPSPQLYLASLTSVPVEGGRFTVAGRSYAIARMPHPVMPNPMREDLDRMYAASGVEIPGCVLEGPGGALPLGNLMEGWHLPDCPIAPRSGDTQSTVQLDPRGDYAVIRTYLYTGPWSMMAFGSVADERTFRIDDVDSRYGLAFRVSDGARVELDTRTLADRLGAPREAVALAVLGAVATGMLIALARRRRSAGLESLATAVAILSSAALLGAHAAGI